MEAEPLLQPPRWARAFVLFALPCDPIRDAILGDLHEEFVDDATERGAPLARARYVRRSAGIVIRAVADAMIWREWVSTGPAAPVAAAPVKMPRPRAAAGSFAGFVIVALIVLVAAGVANTVLYSASQAHGWSIAGVGGVAVLVACVGIGAVILCAGPRRRRKSGAP